MSIILGFSSFAWLNDEPRPPTAGYQLLRSDHVPGTVRSQVIRRDFDPQTTESHVAWTLSCTEAGDVAGCPSVKERKTNNVLKINKWLKIKEQRSYFLFLLFFLQFNRIIQKKLNIETGLDKHDDTLHSVFCCATFRGHHCNQAVPVTLCNSNKTFAPAKCFGPLLVSRQLQLPQVWWAPSPG